jgi:hypothetical protein
LLFRSASLPQSKQLIIKGLWLNLGFSSLNSDCQKTPKIASFRRLTVTYLSPVRHPRLSGFSRHRKPFPHHTPGD